LASSPTSTAARKRARDKGLAWVSAITLGAGAASAIGVAAFAVTLPSHTAATGTTASSTNTSTNSAQTSSLQGVAAPTTSNNSPVATTAAS
jgi:hypothetical protein